MNLSSVHHVDENEDHFLVHPKSGTPFRIAKAGLKPETVQAIQHFAGGGEAGDDPDPSAGLNPQDVDAMNARSLQWAEKYQAPWRAVPVQPQPESFSIPGVQVAVPKVPVLPGIDVDVSPPRLPPGTTPGMVMKGKNDLRRWGQNIEAVSNPRPTPVQVQKGPASPRPRGSAPPRYAAGGDVTTDSATGGKRAYASGDQVRHFYEGGDRGTSPALAEMAAQEDAAQRASLGTPQLDPNTYSAVQAPGMVAGAADAVVSAENAIAQPLVDARARAEADNLAAGRNALPPVKSFTPGNPQNPNQQNPTPPQQRLVGGFGPDPYLSGIRGAAGEQAEAARAQSQAEIVQNYARADVLKNQLTDLQGVDAHKQAMDAAYQQTREGELQKFRDLTSQYADTKIDPHQFWASRSTGEKVLAAIGLALGSFSQDGVNRSVQVLDNAINRDIDAQKANLEVKGRAATQQANLLGIMRGNYETDSTALAATRATMKETALIQIDEMLARTSEPVAKAKLQALQAQIKQGMFKDLQTGDLDWRAKSSESAYRVAALNRMGVGQGNEDAAVNAAAKEWMDAASSLSSAVPLVQTQAKARMSAAENAMLNALGWRPTDENRKRVQQMLPGLGARVGAAMDPGAAQEQVRQISGNIRMGHYAKSPAGKETRSEDYE